MKDKHFKWFSLAVAIAAAAFIFLTGCREKGKVRGIQPGNGISVDTSECIITLSADTTLLKSTPGTYSRIRGGTIDLTGKVFTGRPLMRYFLVSYAFPRGVGRLLVESEIFPSEKMVEKEISEKKAAVVSIYEFQDSTDYKNFSK